MIKLINILKEITEGKQIGDIYHFTSTDALGTMIEESGNITLDIGEGSFAAGGYYSFTRNPNLGTLAEEKHHVRIKLDGDKMSTRYKFEPYADKSSGEDFLKGGSYFEAEERINSKGKPINLTPFIEEITILSPEKFQEYLDDYHSGSEDSKYYKEIVRLYNVGLDWIKSSGIPYKLIGKRTTAGIRQNERNLKDKLK
jgi:hypothetical protein